MSNLSDKVIVEVGLNESQLKSANANVPYSPEEIAADARRCYDAGAAVVHYHARDPETAQTTTDIEINLEAQRLITESTPLIAYPTYGDRIPAADGYYEICSPARTRFAHFVAGVRSGIRFEVGPIDLGSAFDLNAYRSAESALLPGLNGASAVPGWRLARGHQINSGDDHAWLSNFCHEYGLHPTFAAFDCMHLLNLRNILDMGLVDPEVVVLKLFLPYHQILKTRFHSMLQQARELFPDRKLCWMPVVVGGDGFPLAPLAIADGGHVRTGIGDHHYGDQGSPTNAAMVERMVTLIRSMGKEPATPAEAREIKRMHPLREPALRR